MKITIDKVKTLGPCYTTARIKSIAGSRKSMTLMEILDLDIPANDRVWVVSQLLPEKSRIKFAVSCAERAIRTAYAGASVDWQIWADQWLSGEDRSAASSARAGSAEWFASVAISAAWAGSAAWAASVAASAAWAAKDATGDAAWHAEVEKQITELRELARDK